MRGVVLILTAAASLGLGAIMAPATAEARGRFVHAGGLFTAASGYAYGPRYYGSGPPFGAYVPPPYYDEVVFGGYVPAYYGYRRVIRPAHVYDGGPGYYRGGCVLSKPC